MENSPEIEKVLATRWVALLTVMVGRVVAVRCGAMRVNWDGAWLEVRVERNLGREIERGSIPVVNSAGSSRGGQSRGRMIDDLAHFCCLSSACPPSNPGTAGFSGNGSR